MKALSYTVEETADYTHFDYSIIEVLNDSHFEALAVEIVSASNTITVLRETVAECRDYMHELYDDDTRLVFTHNTQQQHSRRKEAVNTHILNS